MSMDVVILRCLSGICQEELQMFERAIVTFDTEDSKSCYVCIGKHCICFVVKEMNKLVDGCGKLSYQRIEKAVTDSSTRRYFLLELAESDAGSSVDYDWEGGTRLLVESHHRDMMLECVARCWQAECMFRTFQVRKFPQAKATIGTLIVDPRVLDNKNNIDLMQVRPFKGYQDGFSHRGYSIFLRQGFKSASGLKNGTFVHEEGWEVQYNTLPVVVPPGVEVSLHVAEPVVSTELERSVTGQDDLRTVAMTYKQALIEHLDQFYILVNSSYMKKMNRAGDIASWDGWEFLIRAKEAVFACVLFRREYIPPLCETVQDLAVLLRCPAQGINQDACEVLLDECHFIADSLAPIAEAKLAYNDIIQARLDTLQCTDEAYRWLEGNLQLTPTHKRPAGVKFVKSIVKLLDREGQLLDETILEAEVFKDIPVLNDPLHVAQEILSDSEPLLGHTAHKKSLDERRNALHWRISRYLAVCVDGGIMGERFTISTLVQAMGRDGGEADKILRSIVEFLLHITPRDDVSHSWQGSRISLAQLLQEPDEFGKYVFNRNVMRTLLTENYIANEWRKRSRLSVGGNYERLLAILLVTDAVGLSLRTLICRQILENTNSKDQIQESDVRYLVPALIKAMQGDNVSLTSCATAALVNLSANRESTKNLLVSEGVLKLCMKQLKSKDDDMTLYTLYLLVNLTKTAHHRAIVSREGGIPLLVDILTSSYQNPRKSKILTEVASVVGQLSNDAETRTVMSDDYPMVLCLLWINDQAQPNTKLKAKLLFALRQLCVSGQNKIKVGQHVIPDTLDQIAQAKPKFIDCVTNAVLLLMMLASIRSNALLMSRQNKLNDALEQCGLQQDGQESKKHKFGPGLWDKVVALKDRVEKEVVMDG